MSPGLAFGGRRRVLKLFSGVSGVGHAVPYSKNRARANHKRVN
jgi:hypothetical protein